MKAKSAKAKGSKLEHYIANTIKDCGLDLNARRSFLSGATDIEKGDVISSLPYTIECKNHKAVHILQWVEQARAEALKANNKPSNWLLVFCNPKKPQCKDNLVVMEWEVLLELLKSQKETVEIPVKKELNSEQAYALKQVKYWCNRVIKKLK